MFKCLSILALRCETTGHLEKMLELEKESSPTDFDGNRYRLMMDSFKNPDLAQSCWLFRTAQCFRGFFDLMSP